ncbi:shikimate dehydrogenase [Pseudonocardia acaciae]|uniref:shikimate dehydrogenase n=1 Tax=Pseudonocardia acaciae TaxID=551276 RepID=UPI001B80C060|nr:shikimate dehydrogenase [Pseudonocardia acaciae]
MAEYLVGLVGRGIGPSLSPSLHEREATALGLRYRYRLLDLDVLGVPARGVGGLLVRALAEGYRGLNITHPCKQLVVEHLDSLSADAEAVGAVNTVVFDGGRAVGHNTDVTGFARAVRTGLAGAAQRRVVLLGAGGAGAAAGYALLAAGTSDLEVVDVDHGRAGALAGRLRRRFGERAARAVEAGAELGERLNGADGLVHATPTGMAGTPGTALRPELLRPPLWVADLVYRPLRTELLRAARARGCRTLDGGRMAVHQAADAFELFTGTPPDRCRMLRHFAEEASRAR